MGFVIMAYAREVFKEYFLPAVNNTDYSIRLEGGLFTLPKDLDVGLEVLDGQWRFTASADYSLTGSDGKSFFERAITNGDTLTLRTPDGGKLTFVITESVRSFGNFRKYDISSVNQVSIGSRSNNLIQYNFMGFISGNHAIMERSQNGWTLYDTSSNGTFINSRKLTGPRTLQFGDCILIFGLKIVFLGNVLAVCDGFGTERVNVWGLNEYKPSWQEQGDSHQAPRQAAQEPKKLFKRAPRNLPSLYTDNVEIEAPPTYRETKEKPLLMVIGPSFTMAIPMMLGSFMVIFSMTMNGGGASAYMFTGIITALGSAIVGVIWALTNLRYEKQVRQEERDQRYNAYGNYLIEIADTLRDYYESNRRVMNEAYIPAENCCRYDLHTVELWNRNIGHKDFLAVRLGIGSVPFQVDISIPKKKFELYSDELTEKPAQIRENYSTLFDVPVCMDLLEKNLIGIVGGAGMTGARQVLQDIVAQIAVNNCYTEVKMAFLYEIHTKDDEAFWGFARWLPHTWTADRKVRMVAENKADVSDVCYELAQILRQRVEETDNRSEGRPMPHYVLFVENPKLLEGELLAKYALSPSPECGLTTVLLAENYEDLPNGCEDIIQNDGRAASFYNLAENSADAVQVRFDSVPSGQLEQLARRLADIEVPESVGAGEIPASIDFMEMYGIRTLEELGVAERWAKNRTYESLKAMIGKKGGGMDCYLDIHEKFHGPHGLVAGTTGSGKSETLQTYMLSLAVNFSPYDIGFFIIDFKGGGMANLFSDLPHLIGQISNLSGNQVHRAMISIKSEITRRQRVFGDNNVNNINLYTRLYKNGEATQPIPHLFIIIDEFAELKREEPEFMKELISVAQVGRSLGIHLILATQKPSGTVDDNIWSNSKFRLCLRVQDRQDSQDMLHKPDAAYITQAGRGYLQVGNDEIYEQFQSGYSGAVYDSESISQGAIATMLTTTGKEALVGNRMKKQHSENKRKQWLTSLVYIIRESAEYYGVSLEEIVLSERFDELYDVIFKMIADAGYTFEDSVQGRKSLKDFADALADQRGLDVEEAVDRICAKAARSGMKLPEMKDKTQLEAVVDYLGVVARENHYEESMALWLPVLPKMLPWDALGREASADYLASWREAPAKWGLSAVIGLYDDPENQEQQPFAINLGENGHYAVCGTVVTGKSTLLQTFVYAMICKYSPQNVNFYLLDFSSRMLSCFEEAPHVGGVVYDDNPERLRKFMHMLGSMMDERKQILKGGNYQQYVQAHGVTMPAVVVVIDNYSAFKEKTDNAYEAVLNRLSREGVGYGIFWVVSSGGFGAAEIPNRIGTNIRNVIALEMGDRFKFADTLRVTRVDILPEIDVKGRGLGVVGGRILEFQTAVAVEAEDDYKRSEYIEGICADMSAHWGKAKARRIPEIPEKPMLLSYADTDEFREMVSGGERLPAGYYFADATYYGVNLRTTYCYTISGKSRTGKTNYMKNLIYAAGQRADAHSCVIEPAGTELEKIASRFGMTYARTDDEIFAFFKDTVPVFTARNKKKRSLLEQVTEDELFDNMKEDKPYFIFIADLPSFMDSIYRKRENAASMSGYVENIIERGSFHNFYFFACINSDQAAGLVKYKAYNSFAGYHQGVHLGGNVSSQRLFTFTNIPFAEQSKPSKVGRGLVPSEEDASAAVSIVIPLAKGV